MATTKTKQMEPPKIPETPSRTINEMLQKRCDRSFDNAIHAHVVYFICGVFSAMTQLYNILNKNKDRHSYTMWCVSCGIVGVSCMLASYIVYSLVMASAFLVHGALFYSFLAIALLGLGLSVSGMLFFDKEGSKPTQTTATTSTTHSSAYQTSTISGSSSAYTKLD